MLGGQQATGPRRLPWRLSLLDAVEARRIVRLIEHLVWVEVIGAITVVRTIAVEGCDAAKEIACALLLVSHCRQSETRQRPRDLRHKRPPH